MLRCLVPQHSGETVPEALLRTLSSHLRCPSPPKLLTGHRLWGRFVLVPDESELPLGTKALFSRPLSRSHLCTHRKRQPSALCSARGDGRRNDGLWSQQDHLSPRSCCGLSHSRIGDGGTMAALWPLPVPLEGLGFNVPPAGRRPSLRGVWTQMDGFPLLWKSVPGEHRTSCPAPHRSLQTVSPWECRLSREAELIWSRVY